MDHQGQGALDWMRKGHGSLRAHRPTRLDWQPTCRFSLLTLCRFENTLWLLPMPEFLEGNEFRRPPPAPALCGRARRLAKDHGISDRSYQRGVRELLEKQFLFRSPSDEVFFVNIRFMFNGEQLAFVRTYHLKGSARRAVRQPELPFNATPPRRFRGRQAAEGHRNNPRSTVWRGRSSPSEPGRMTMRARCGKLCRGDLCKSCSWAWRVLRLSGVGASGLLTPDRSG